MNIFSAHQDHVDQEHEAITALLNLLGHPEAFVTDLAEFSDFLSTYEFDCSFEKAQAHLDTLLPVPVPLNSTLIAGLAIIRQSFPNWPKETVIQ